VNGSMVMAVVSVSGLLVGCASSGVDLEAVGHVTLLRENSERVKIASAHATQRENGVRIGGTVKRTYPGFGGTYGHVDIKMVGPDGTVLARADAQYYPRFIRRRGPKTSSFSRTVPVELPANTTVYLRPHANRQPACDSGWSTGPDD